MIREWTREYFGRKKSFGMHISRKKEKEMPPKLKDIIIISRKKLAE